jgi:hypothetical protein
MHLNMKWIELLWVYLFRLRKRTLQCMKRIGILYLLVITALFTGSLTVQPAQGTGTTTKVKIAQYTACMESLIGGDYLSIDQIAIPRCKKYRPPSSEAKVIEYTLCMEFLTAGDYLSIDQIAKPRCKKYRPATKAAKTIEYNVCMAFLTTDFLSIEQIAKPTCKKYRP